MLSLSVATDGYLPLNTISIAVNGYISGLIRQEENSGGAWLFLLRERIRQEQDRNKKNAQRKGEALQFIKDAVTIANDIPAIEYTGKDLSQLLLIAKEIEALLAAKVLDEVNQESVKILQAFINNGITGADKDYIASNNLAILLGLT